MRNKLHTWLLRHLLKGDSAFKEADINRENRTIYLGFYGMNKHFMEAKHDLIVSVLVRWYGYKCFETRLVIR